MGQSLGFPCHQPPLFRLKKYTHLRGHIVGCPPGIASFPIRHRREGQHCRQVYNHLVHRQAAVHRGTHFYPQRRTWRRRRRWGVPSCSGSELCWISVFLNFWSFWWCLDLVNIIVILYVCSMQWRYRGVIWWCWMQKWLGRRMLWWRDLKSPGTWISHLGFMGFGLLMMYVINWILVRFHGLILIWSFPSVL